MSQKPSNHFKCRYNGNNDETTELFTRTKDVKRFKVPDDKVDWSVDYKEYNPSNFTSDKIKSKKGAYVDPDIEENTFNEIKFNAIDDKYLCDRVSHHGPYKMVSFSTDIKAQVPQNPVGRTGIIGRGHLGRWGPNHAADSIVTRWKKDADGKVIQDTETKKQILQFIAIQRRDTQEWAIPGGMRDPGEVIGKTMIREFVEETLSTSIEFTTENKIDPKSDLEEKLKVLFSQQLEIYKGYVDDPRNTDNAWMETLACNLHDETGEFVNSFKLEGGDDARDAQWIDINSKLKLFASHRDFIEKVAEKHKAHW